MSILAEHTDCLDPGKNYVMTEDGEWVEEKPRKPHNSQKWFKINEMAKAYDMTTSRIRYAINHGHLKATQLSNGTYIIAENDISDYLENPSEIRNEEQYQKDKKRKAREAKIRRGTDKRPVDIQKVMKELSDYIKKIEEDAYNRGFDDGRQAVIDQVSKMGRTE